MDILSRKHLSTWTIALLVLLNCATLGALWLAILHKPEAPPRRDGGRSEAAPPAEGRADDVRLYLERELDLSPDQAAKFEEMRRRHAAAIQSVQNEIQRLKKAEMDGLLAPQPDPAAGDSLAAQIGAKETEKEKLLYAHLRDLMALCRPDQQTKFRGILGELLRLMSPPGRQPAGDRPRGEAAPEIKPPHRPGEKPRDDRPPEGLEKRPPQQIR